MRGTSVVCLVALARPWRLPITMAQQGSTIHDVSHVAVYAMGISLAAILVWGIIDCAGKWGQPGCRD